MAGATKRALVFAVDVGASMTLAEEVAADVVQSLMLQSTEHEIGLVTYGPPLVKKPEEVEFCEFYGAGVSHPIALGKKTVSMLETVKDTLRVRIDGDGDPPAALHFALEAMNKRTSNGKYERSIYLVSNLCARLPQTSDIDEELGLLSEAFQNPNAPTHFHLVVAGPIESSKEVQVQNEQMWTSFVEYLGDGSTLKSANDLLPAIQKRLRKKKRMPTNQLELVREIEAQELRDISSQELCGASPPAKPPSSPSEEVAGSSSSSGGGGGASGTVIKRGKGKAAAAPAPSDGRVEKRSRCEKSEPVQRKAGSSGASGNSDDCAFSPNFDDLPLPLQLQPPLPPGLDVFRDCPPEWLGKLPPSPRDKWTYAAAAPFDGVLGIRDFASTWRRELVDVPLESLEALAVMERMMQTMPNVQLVGVSRVQNDGLLMLYQMEQKKMFQFDPDCNPNERLLFHGTSATPPRQIIDHRDGLMPQHGNSGGAYGPGVYFAEQASYSDDFAHVDPTRRGVKCMLLCRVLVGDAKQLPPGQYKEPPEKIGVAGTPAGARYDSITNGAGHFITYHNYRSYIEYILEYHTLGSAADPTGQGRVAMSQRQIASSSATAATSAFSASNVSFARFSPQASALPSPSVKPARVRLISERSTVWPQARHGSNSVGGASSRSVGPALVEVDSDFDN